MIIYDFIDDFCQTLSKSKVKIWKKTMKILSKLLIIEPVKEEAERLIDRPTWPIPGMPARLKPQGMDAAL